MRYQLHAPGTRKGNRTWVARGTVDGRQFEKILEATTRPAAAKEAEQFVARLQGYRPGEIVTFEQAARAYIEFRRPRRDDEKWINRLIQWMGKRPVGELVGADLVAAAHALCPKSSNETKNRNVITPASAILHYAAEQRWCAYARHRRLPASRISKRRPAQADTVELLLANTEGHKRLLLAWLYETGQRITDSLRLTREDLDLRAGVARVGSSKTDDRGEIGLSPELVSMLANAPYLPAGRVFPWRDRHGVYRWLRPLCARLGVSYTPHQSRHAMATDMRALGYDMRRIAERGLWRDERSAGRYVHHRSTALPERGVVLLMGDRRGKRKPRV